MVNNFAVKDSGNRQEFTTGSRRDTDDDKPDYTLESRHAKKRLAYHLTKGAKKYGRRNWELGQPVSRFLASLYRHIEQYMAGDREEDHLAAALFNVGGIIHMEEEVELGNLPADLLDLPFYKKEVKTKPPAVDPSLKQKLYDAITKQTRQNGIGYSVGVLALVVAPHLKVAFKDIFPSLNELIKDGDVSCAKFKGDGNREYIMYFPGYYTSEEIINRIKKAIGEAPNVNFVSDYDPYWKERPENAHYLEEKDDDGEFYSEYD